MFLQHFILFVITVIGNAQDVEMVPYILDSANTPIKIIQSDVLLMEKESTVQANKPKLQLYYESLCPGCIDFVSGQFKNVVELLHSYVEIHTYPYGNARTITNSDVNIDVVCQHGPKECYGNKLHCCALDIISNSTEALLFNACMIEHHSDDASADTCGEQMNVKVDSIKECANGDKGLELLVYYGNESKKADFKYVPYVLLNGKEWQHDDLFSDVCATFQEPPEPCKQKF